jgi:hypothetical protein
MIIMTRAMNNIIRRKRGSMAKMKIEKCFDLIELITLVFRPGTNNNNINGF